MLFSMQVLEATGVKIGGIDMWEIQDFGNVLLRITSNQHFACFSQIRYHILYILEATGMKQDKIDMYEI